MMAPKKARKNTRKTGKYNCPQTQLQSWSWRIQEDTAAYIQRRRMERKQRENEEAERLHRERMRVGRKGEATDGGDRGGN